MRDSQLRKLREKGGLYLLDLRSAKMQLLCILLRKSMIYTRKIQLDTSTFYTIHVQCSDYMFWLIRWPRNVVSTLHTDSVKLLVIKEE
jgi:hypothetical protein